MQHTDPELQSPPADDPSTRTPDIPVQVNAADRETRGVDEDMVRTHVRRQLERFAAQITRVEVHLRDVNGPRGASSDKQCMMEVRLAGMDPFAVTENAADLDSAVSGAAGKLHRLITSELGKRGRR